ncbi:inositol-3-phosphate synthase [Sphaeroforma arctica JP610]|uniref:inositol-3-phosphate synthase n=1 Tax=Sphaeroforma arctica JP610 TaxID=667725 RepID=A0A0L0FJB9_9EUKA|nr:inositol-3-phosphate synthase [Sphaeroforma arctica JP610]KNC76882.1 inositol-3-phosphate synthase [Sphaeroforma arctica JP610]|eukprot:XP_014150784.1 inositol-3-phosphate synthase [Sphaeroforma arctica JP610]
MSRRFSTEKGMDVPNIEVDSENVEYTEEHITAKYLYTKNQVKVEENTVKVTPGFHKYTFQTERKVGKTGVMLIGLGGNNGSTITAAILANKHNVCWNGRTGKLEPNYFGSLTQASTIRLGSTNDGEEIHVPFNSLLPMAHPNDFVVGGWDINGANLADATDRAAVLDYDLRQKLRPELEKITPMPSIYYPDFIAANQADRADNVLSTGSKQKDLEKIRSDIKEFKSKHDLDTVVVLWTANTERFTDVEPGLNMTADEILNSVKENKDEVSPSNIFAIASILEGCPYINGSPQNTLVPGVIELSEKHNVFIGGDDFKSGQTKMKSVLMDFLVSAGIKVEAIASYNHLGNNDGKNLDAPAQFRSKEISKSNVVDDMVAMNSILYKEGEHPDHVVVIKYIPTVGDSKRALDEYTSRIFMNGMNTIVMHNTCEDSLLATPLIIDLVCMTELMTRIKYKTSDSPDWQSFKPVLSVLSYMLKAPLVPKGTPVVNALMKQQRCATNILMACIGLNPDHDMLLEHKTNLPGTVSREEL